MNDPLLDSYDTVPYDPGAITPTHPDVLATVAALHGMSPAPVDTCRVLELGCGTGANLIGIAMTIPRSQLVGIDLAPRQIETGRALAAALELTSVRLEAMSIADVDERLGTFDYVICHGVYSWVPAGVRDAILRVCARNLAAEGVAYVSYNTYPGWHSRGMVRDMILFHDEPDLPPQERVNRGRELVDFIAASVGTTSGSLRAIIGEECSTLGGMSDSHFLHEQLETYNQPVYYFEFAQHAAEHGLRCFSESSLSVSVSSLPADARQRLAGWTNDPVRQEQYLDFIRNRTFRRTLLCHAGVATSREPRADVVPSLFVAARALPSDAAADSRAAVAEEFTSPEGVSVRTNQPVVRAALHVLSAARPDALPFAELWDRVCHRLPPDEHPPTDGPGEAWLAHTILELATAQLVELHVHRPKFSLRVTDRPVGSPLARREAAAGNRVTNLRHSRVMLLEFDRILLLHLDGTRGRTELADVLGRLVADGTIAIEDRSRLEPDELSAAVDGSLRRLAATALLVA